MEIAFKLEDIDEVAKRFFSFSSGYKVFTFKGDLGAGKTTFINALCKEMGILDKVTSPTYSLIQEYVAPNNEIVYHMDFYRIRSLEEAIEAGAGECISSGKICMIEWPFKIDDLLPFDTVRSAIFTLDNSMRKLVVQLPQ
ncbi:MAG: tRNA (adenosine(37)-N6)-threonylcarbamoyltransferase complex ATPase subunit type 1 TsaE [Bacteroidota bacterium]|nr:tRNA (adenosine(37)-N6)-threonylcarbamoyltransferase complex ATPase subunit type 1 TsaE [Bacteroidota bacterium]MDQ6889172.1 tRNA (adenosine(37)-N6)-threonylcarbamoyltransferase complex ATPase subunit type 1 TsaE [Bacteroidota bacterium]